MWIFEYLGGAFLGWSLGANDSANVFGTAVSSRMVSYRLAVILTGIFIILGAVLQGEAGIRTYSEQLRNKKQIELKGTSVSDAEANRIRAMKTAMIISFSAALTVTIMTILKVPVSTSQAAVGAIIGVGLLQQAVNFGGLGKVVVCWLLTPIGGAIFTYILYWLLRMPVKKLLPNTFLYDPVMSFLLILCGCYGAYALGANNVANVTGVFVGPGMLSVKQAAWGGGIAIAIGAVTYSKPVMMTVGKGIVRLDSYTAFICVLAHAITVHIFAMIGVPVSSSQAIVGAVLGIGFIKGAQTINYRMLMHVTGGWVATPFIAAVMAALGYVIANLRLVL